MKSKRAKALVAIGVICVCLIVTVATLAGVAKEAEDMSKENTIASRWMQYIKGDTPLVNLVIPGAHDAGTKGMMWMAETQSLSVLDQLEAGTRYLDLRVKKKKGEYVINHTVINGQKLSIVLDDINRFLKENPSETVLVDFQKFSGDDGCQEGVYSMLKDVFGSRILANNTQMTDVEFVSTLTLSQARGKCLIFWGDENIKTENDANLFVRDEDCNLRENSVLHSYYLRKFNTQVSKEYVKKYIPEYIEMFKAQGEGFFVLQGQLSDPVYIVGPKVMEATHEKNMSDCIDALALGDNLQYINIIMRDFVGIRKNAQIILLNINKSFVENEDEFLSKFEAII